MGPARKVYAINRQSSLATCRPEELSSLEIVPQKDFIDGRRRLPIRKEQPDEEKVDTQHRTSIDADDSAPILDHLSLTSSMILIDHRRVVYFTLWALVSRPGTVDRAKRKVEEFLMCPIVWWPLQPSKVVCPRDYIRISWNCGCGAEIYTDLPAGTAEQYAKRCTPITLSPPSNASLLPVFNTRPSTSASASGALTQAGSANPSSNITQRSVPSRTPTTAHDPSIPDPQQAEIISTISRNRFLHWCVDANISDTHLFHIPVPNLKDTSVLSELRAKFNAAKGFRKWISLTDCHNIKFVKFKRLSIHHSKELISSTGKEDLPPRINGGEYIYKYEDPLEEFIQALRQSLLHHMHNPSCCSTEDIQDTLDRIPKKANGRLVNKRHTEGYGILALPGLAFWKVIVALALAHIGPLIFLGHWLHGHPGDLQNGTQLLFYTMMLLALLVVIPDMWSLWTVKR